jgi:hypothetical protein
MAVGMSTSKNYVTSQGYQVSMSRGILRGAGTSSMDSMAEQDLGDLWGAGGGTLGNSAQAAYSSAFMNAQAEPPVTFGTFLASPGPQPSRVVPQQPQQPVLPVPAAAEEKSASSGK